MTDALISPIAVREPTSGPSRSSASVPAPSITDNRIENKYRIAPSRTAQFIATVTAHLDQHHFSGKGGNPLPRARHYVTTVYFDTPSRALYRAVAHDESNMKIRAREYYDLHPELLENVTNARDIVRYTPVLWIELKAKTDGRTRKRRIGIPKTDVASFFERGEVSAAMREIQLQASGAQGDDFIAELLRIRERFSEPLGPSCIVNYRRTAWQNQDSTLRVTLDQKLACFAPSAGLFTSEAPLVRESLGTPAYEEPKHVVEIKVRGSVPEWLESLVRSSNADLSSFSKFVTASSAVHGTSV